MVTTSPTVKLLAWVVVMVTVVPDSVALAAEVARDAVVESNTREPCTWPSVCSPVRVTLGSDCARRG